MNTAEKKALARAFFEMYNKNKPADLDTVYASNFVSHDPANPDLPRGPAAMRQIIKTYRTAFPDSRFTVEEQVAEGDFVVTRWTAKGTHKGPLRGIAATNKKVSLSGINMVRVAGDQIVEAWANWDALGMMQQIGAVPTPKKAVAS